MKTSLKHLTAVLLILLGGSVRSAAEIAFCQDFDSGSLHISETHIEGADTDEPIITLAPRAVRSAGRLFHFDITGIEGKRPLFRAPLKGSGRRAHHLDHRYVYSLDSGKTFRFFNNAAHEDGYYCFSPDRPFPQDSVRIAYALPYTVMHTTQLIGRIIDSPWVRPTASANDRLIIDFTPGTENGGYYDDLGRTIPRFPLFGFQITDRSADDTEKLNIVMTSGTHASEMSAHFALEGTILFLLSDAPEAAELRRRAVVYIYPQVNPEGRWAGYMRSSPEYPQIDVNRDWTDEPQNTVVQLISNAILRDTNQNAAVVLDFHSHRNAYLEILDHRSDGPERPYFAALKEYRPNLRFHRTPIRNHIRRWGQEQLGAIESVTLEMGFIAGWMEQEYHFIGHDHARALLHTIRFIQYNSRARQYSINFSDTNNENLRKDWRMPWTESCWTIQQTPPVLIHTVDEADGRRALIWKKPGHIVGDVELHAIVRGRSNGTLFQLPLHVRGEAGKEYAYYVDVHVTRKKIRLNRYLRGSFSTLDDAPFQAKQNTWYHVRFRREHAKLMARVWEKGQQEPNHWHVESTDIEHRDGWIGLAGFRSGSVNEWAFLGVGTGGKPAPGPDCDPAMGFR